eukprot:GHVS01090659.1.p1 GENE.GHVS01090659.1~~GHVS01090659.1.p1  ORF type:complete len:110 (+),score=7.58 GHVS01090659.1:441-770(+)
MGSVLNVGDTVICPNIPLLTNVLDIDRRHADVIKTHVSQLMLDILVNLTARELWVNNNVNEDANIFEQESFVGVLDRWVGLKPLMCNDSLSAYLKKARIDMKIPYDQNL